LPLHAELVGEHGEIAVHLVRVEHVGHVVPSVRRDGLRPHLLAIRSGLSEHLLVRRGRRGPCERDGPVEKVEAGGRPEAAEQGGVGLPAVVEGIESEDGWFHYGPIQW
jgi:hypothetical protein